MASYDEAVKDIERQLSGFEDQYNKKTSREVKMEMEQALSYLRKLFIDEANAWRGNYNPVVYQRTKESISPNLFQTKVRKVGDRYIGELEVADGPADYRDITARERYIRMSEGWRNSRTYGDRKPVELFDYFDGTGALGQIATKFFTAYNGVDWVEDIMISWSDDV